jgi:hypothetical protein
MACVCLLEAHIYAMLACAHIGSAPITVTHPPRHAAAVTPWQGVEWYLFCLDDPLLLYDEPIVRSYCNTADKLSGGAWAAVQGRGGHKGDAFGG